MKQAGAEEMEEIGERHPCGEFITHSHFLDVFGEDCKNSQVFGVASLKDEKRQGSFGAKDHEFIVGHVNLEVPVGPTCGEVQVGAEE